MITCGLWFGCNKPFMAAFTLPLHKSLQVLERGITVNIDGGDTICKTFLLCLSADLPARSSVLNMVQFNGAYSCVKCLQRGENFRTQNGGNIHIFPYQELDPKRPERTKEDVDAHAAHS